VVSGSSSAVGAGVGAGDRGSTSQATARAPGAPFAASQSTTLLPTRPGGARDSKRPSSLGGPHELSCNGVQVRCRRPIPRGSLGPSLVSFCSRGCAADEWGWGRGEDFAHGCWSRVRRGPPPVSVKMLVAKSLPVNGPPLRCWPRPGAAVGDRVVDDLFLFVVVSVELSAVAAGEDHLWGPRVVCRLKLSSKCRRTRRPPEM